MANESILQSTTGLFNATLGGSATQFAPIAGEIGGNIGLNTEAHSEVPLRSAGTFSKLYVRVSANTVSGATTAFTFRYGTTDSGITLTYGTSATGVLEDTTHTQAVSAGDKVKTKVFFSASTNATITVELISYIFASTTDTITLLTTHISAGISITNASTTQYLGLNGLITTQPTEANVKVDMKKAGVLDNLAVYVSANARTTNTVFMSRKNGADGAMTVTFGNVETGLKEDTVNTDTLAIGDDSNSRYTTSTGTSTLTFRLVKCEFISTAGFGLLLAEANTPPSFGASVIKYIPVSGKMLATITTEANTQQTARFAFTVSNIAAFVTISGAGAGTAKLRVNTADGNNVATLTASTTGVFEDTTHTDVLTTTDLIDYAVDPSSSNKTLGWVSCITVNVANQNFNRPLTAETITVSESIARLKGANRALSDSPAITEAIARAFIGTRVLSAETNTIGETIAKVKGSVRAPTAETNTIGESLARLYGANRSLSDTTVISEAIAKVVALTRALTDTITISESLAKILGKIKALSDTTAISESIARVFVGVRALSAETNTIGESLARLKGANRSLSDTTTIGESLSRLLGAVRSLSDTTAISESLARTYNAIRALATQTISVSEALAKVQTLVRSLSDTTVISESLARLLAAIRALSDTSAISESLTKVHTPAGGAFFDRPLAAQTVAISESVVRAITNVRSLSDTTGISEILSRLIVVVRSLSDTTAISSTLARVLGAIRSLSDTTAVSESLTRILGIVKSLSQTTAITDSLTTLKILTRALIETVIISETLSRLQTLTRILSTQIIAITESLTGFFASGTIVRALAIETVIISEVLARAQTLTRTLTENTIITDILEALKAIIIPLWQRPTGVRRPEGVGSRTRANERESDLYLRKQLTKIIRRVGSLGRWRNSLG